MTKLSGYYLGYLGKRIEITEHMQRYNGVAKGAMTGISNQQAKMPQQQNICSCSYYRANLSVLLVNAAMHYTIMSWVLYGGQPTAVELE